MFAEEFLILDGDSPLFRSMSPLLAAALRLDQHEDDYVWHGWRKSQMSRFLASLPAECSLLVGVWEAAPGPDEPVERLALGCMLEVIGGEIRSVRTFDSLVAAGLKPVEQLEAGVEDALDLMRLARAQVAPVAWALFIDKPAWDAWLFAEDEVGQQTDKGELLAALARQGRCVLMGSQVQHAHHAF